MLISSINVAIEMSAKTQLNVQLFMFLNVCVADCFPTDRSLNMQLMYDICTSVKFNT